MPDPSGSEIHINVSTAMLHSIVCFFCLLAALLSTPVLTQRVTVQYSELQMLNADCPPRDTCKAVREEDTLAAANCHCGSYCTQFDSCCLDSKFRGSSTSNMIPHNCVSLNYRVRMYMVDRCNPNWKGDAYVKDMCLADGHALSDPILLIPATNPRTQATYKNYFCAACNGDDLNDVTLWNVRITRFDAELPISDLPKLKFDSSMHNWVIQDGDHEPEFVRFEQEAPPHITRHVKTCLGYVIGSCARSWRNNVIRSKCAAYTAIVVVNDKQYKNIHCAICNLERNISSVSCVKVYPSGSGASGGRQPVSFALLLDVNRSDGDRVGVVERCEEKELYDPFFKKCRALSCALPGQTIKEGKCTRN